MSRRLGGAVLADAAVVVAFAAIGRRSHDERGGLEGTVTTAAPFLAALAVAWLGAAAVARFRDRDDDELVRPEHGVAVALATAAMGLVARRTVWDRGTAAAFVVVTTMFLVACFAGWRAAWQRVHHHRNDSGSPAG
jgi:predicted permease